ncbi:MAG: hypothetical protein JWN77_96 [Frankiales bacterium]|nr:hypothetical protein [Frankiales bacterium]
MTRTLDAPTSSGSEQAPDASAPLLTGTDLLAGGAVLVVALLGWAGLVLAHLGAHSLPAVLLLGLAGFAAVLLAARLLGGRVRVRPDPRGLAVAVACAGVAAALTFPGFSYGVADKDPGGYVAHAVEIAHTGDYSFTDPILTAKQPDGRPLDVQLFSPGARLPGVWVKDATTKIIPQFYHLWPALLGTAYEAAGYDGMRLVVPLMGVLAVLLLVALLRRVGDALAGPTAGLFAAGAGGLLLATNMLEVWQARFPTTEVLAEALYLGALLGIVVALQTRWRPAAGIAGLLVGIGWLNRADGVLLVLLAVGIGCALLATRRWDSRATWFAAGLAVVVPHALRQAYDFASVYTAANKIPALPKLAALVAVLVLVAGVLRFLPLHRLTDRLERRSWQLGVGLAVCAGAGLLLVLGFLRPRLFGPDLFLYNGRMIRSYDEQILRRLSWFFTLPGFAVMLLGLAAAALRRWQASVWAVVLPTLVLFPLYGYTASNSTRMLWWTRRYVPTVMPGVLVLVALALAFGFVWRYRGHVVLRVPSVLVLGALVGVFLSQSLPLRAHDEWKGSFAIAQQISDLSPGERGIYVWEHQQPCCNGPTALFAIPVWLAHDEVSVLLPGDERLRTPVLDEYEKAFPDRPIFVLAGAKGLPTGIDPARVTPVAHITTSLPMWDESDLDRPSGSHQVPLDLRVWRLNAR